MNPAFVVNNRNKSAHVYRCVKGALSQTIACDIIIADFASTDNSRAEIERALAECPREAEHKIEYLKVDAPTVSSMAEMNKNLWWLMMERSSAQWIFQCSSDDYSLPARVAVCMKAVEENPCSVVATTQFYESDGERKVSGFPKESGFVKGGAGISGLAFGSCIAAYSREFLEKAGPAGPNTPDVYWGYLAALDKGFYVVANPQHVHSEIADAENVGFGGKLAGSTGDEHERLRELNHFQLLRLYFDLADKVKELHPQGDFPLEDWAPLVHTIQGQSYAWLHARINLHEKKIQPGIL